MYYTCMMDQAVMERIDCNALRHKYCEVGFRWRHGLKEIQFHPSVSPHPRAKLQSYQFESEDEELIEIAGSSTDAIASGSENGRKVSAV